MSKEFLNAKNLPDNQKIVIQSRKIHTELSTGKIGADTEKFWSMVQETDTNITEKDFYQDVHSTIYSVAKQSILNQEKIDKVLIANKIKNLGISFKDEINIFDYVEDLFFTQNLRLGWTVVTEEFPHTSSPPSHHAQG